jgi:HemX protein
MIDFSHWIPPCAYLLAGAVYLWQILSPRETERRWVGVWCLGATGLHLVQILTTALVRQRFPYATMWEAISVAVAVLMLSYILLERLARSEALGHPFLFLAALGTAFSALHTEPAQWPIHVQSGLFLTHVSLGVSGLALLTASSLLAAAWLWQYRQLRTKRFTSLSRRVPDLVTLDRLFLAASSVGAVLLALGGALGLFWMNSWNLPMTNATGKSVTVIIALLWNAAIALLRQRGQFSSRATAMWGLAGIVPVLLVLWAGTRGL